MNISVKQPDNTLTKSKNRISIYQPEQEGLIYPEVPEFETHAEQRNHLKERLVAACRAFALQGYDYGFAGHLTVRDPEFPELYWTNPMCVHFSQVKVSNLILADHNGKIVEGDYAADSTPSGHPVRSHLARHSRAIWPPVPRPSGRAVGAQRRRGGIVSPGWLASSISASVCALIHPSD